MSSKGGLTLCRSRARFTYTRSRRHASNVSQRTCASASEGFWGSGDSEAEDWSGVSMGQGKHKLHPMYVKGTIRAGQAVEHDGSIIVCIVLKAAMCFGQVKVCKFIFSDMYSCCLQE